MVSQDMAPVVLEIFPGNEPEMEKEENHLQYVGHFILHVFGSIFWFEHKSEAEEHSFLAHSPQPANIPLRSVIEAFRSTNLEKNETCITRIMNKRFQK